MKATIGIPRGNVTGGGDISVLAQGMEGDDRPAALAAFASEGVAAEEAHGEQTHSDQDRQRGVICLQIPFLQREQPSEFSSLILYSVT